MCSQPQHLYKAGTISIPWVREQVRKGLRDLAVIVQWGLHPICLLSLTVVIHPLKALSSERSFGIYLHTTLSGVMLFNF